MTQAWPRGIVCILSCLLLAPSALADNAPSLFLSPAEEAALHQHQGEPAVTRLDAIIYYAPGRWQIWIDGRAVDPSAAAPDLTVLDVSPERVRLRQKRGGKQRVFTLAPHQVYLWAEDRVTEARTR